MDRQAIIVPPVWYPRLDHATQGQQRNWQVCGGGYGVEWEVIDEHLSVERLLRGNLLLCLVLSGLFED